MRCRVAVLTLGLGLIVVPSAGAAPPRLKAFDSCKALVDFARAGAERTGGGVGVAPQGVPRPIDAIVTTPVPAPREDNGAVAPTAAPVDGTAVGGTVEDFSGTNVQELGVDEPDVVKTDGRRVFAVTDRMLRVIDVTGGTPIVRGKLALEGQGQQLLVRGDRLLVIASDGLHRPGAPAGRTGRDRRATPAPQTIVTEVDVSDPATPKVARTMTVPGRFVDARQHGATARLVIDSAPDPIAEPDAAGKRAFLGRTVLKSSLRDARSSATSHRVTRSPDRGSSPASTCWRS